MKLRGMSFIVIAFFLSKVGIASSDKVSLDSMAPWKFISSAGSEEIIQIGASLADVLPGKDCCRGTYQWSISSETLKTQLKNVDGPVALYIPAIGGKYYIDINDVRYEGEADGASSTGIVIPLSRDVFAPNLLTIKIGVSSNQNPFAGLWKASPQIGSLAKIDKEHTEDIFQQKFIPLVWSIALLIASLPFFWVYLSNRKTFGQYALFVCSLMSWSLFYFFLTGIPRDWSFNIGASLHFPIRTIAGFGLFAQIASHISIPSKVLKRVTGVFAISLVFQMIFGLLGMATGQELLWVVTAPVTITPLLFFKNKSSSLVGRLVFFLSIVAFAGQTSDSIKLLDGLFPLHYVFPYLNRKVFLPLLLTSFVQYTVQFTGFFQNLKIHRSRLRRFARSTITMGSDESPELNLSKLARSLRRIMTTSRVSISKLENSGTYVVQGVSGVSKDALGSVLRLDKLPEIAEAALLGKVILGQVKIKTGTLFTTPNFAVIPVPLVPHPEYLVLLSDPKQLTPFDKHDIPYLEQFASALWTNFERSRRVQEKLRLESQMSDLFQSLDPNLYQFIKNSVTKAANVKLQVAEDRGIVFFDQKGYSTLLEDLDPSTAAILPKCMASWLAPVVGKYGGRVVSFEGDACLIEVVNLLSENSKSVALRTTNLVWELMATLPELNQNLLSNNLNPVVYRFGAHYGATATINLDFIKLGMTNSVGDNVNVAKRIQDLAPPGKIFLSDSLANLIADTYITRLVANRSVKGRRKLVGVFELIGRINEALEAAS